MLYAYRIIKVSNRKIYYLYGFVSVVVSKLRLIGQYNKRHDGGIKIAYLVLYIPLLITRIHFIIYSIPLVIKVPFRSEIKARRE